MEGSTVQWRKLCSSKTAIFGMVVVLLATLVSLFCYRISPDATPNANRMQVEIAGKKPGFSQRFLLLPKTPRPPETSWWQRMLYGQADSCQFLPIAGHTVSDTAFIVDRYIDEGLSEKMSLPFQQVGGSASDRIITRTFWLGTDKFGRDILSRLLIGTRVSLLVGAVAMLISLLIGTLLGALAGYYGGRADDIIMWFINVIWSIPTLLLVFALTLLLGKGFWQVFVAVGLTMWVNVARLVRGQVMQVRSLEYVQAAKALGFNDLR
ncbi:MAG: ABC transporter permease, partial [Flavihumibacter sp.]